MLKEEKIDSLIDQLVNIRHSKAAADTMKELDRQEQILTIKLETLGVSLNKLPE